MRFHCVLRAVANVHPDHDRFLDRREIAADLRAALSQYVEGLRDDLGRAADLFHSSAWRATMPIVFLGPEPPIMNGMRSWIGRGSHSASTKS